MKPNMIVDTRGLFCPMPVIKTSEALKKLDPGSVVEVISDDPAIELDMPAWCDSQGHIIKSVTKVSGVVKFLVQKREESSK
ncbi:MAG: sulfurtransferase TusA family protein [Candidatus Latescibacterota bacterium]|nr:MAG: sulfurtransferase TusA family protein [Candidatus Latescibacterota bacterium]